MSGKVMLGLVAGLGMAAVVTATTPAASTTPERRYIVMSQDPASIASLDGIETFTVAATAPAAITFTFTGKVTTGMMAIGGETTGTIISDGKTTYELQVPAALRAKVQGLSGKQVTVTGTLTMRAGVEVRERSIVLVETVEAAGAASAPASQAKGG